MHYNYGVIFPVFNEEKRIEKGIETAYKYIKSLEISFLFLIVDNASTDDTGKISEMLCAKYENVAYHRIEEKGVGVAFRTAVKIVDTDIIGYMDIDLSTDIHCFFNVVDIFSRDKSVNIVNGTRFHNASKITGRKWYRNITSYGLIILLKIFFKMKTSDAICGFKFFKRSDLQDLISEASDEKGWFYIIELLIRAEKKNKTIIDLPVRWEDEPTESKVNVVETVVRYMKGIISLKRSLK